MPTSPTAALPPPDFRLDVRNIQSSTLDAIFGTLHAGTAVQGFEVLERAACGDGLASTADRLKLQVHYASNPAALPETVVFKTLLLNPLLRMGLPAILSLSSAVALFEKLPWVGGAAARLLFVIVGVYQKYCPQAPDAMYAVESRFYRDIRPQLDIEAPRVFGAHYDARTRHFAVLMEDLTLRGARFPNALESLPLDTVRSTLRTMAQMHARYWNDPALDTTLNWVPTRFEGGMYPVFNGIGYDLIRYQVEQHPFKQKILEPLGRSVRELWDAMWQTQQQLMAGPRTLLHGDTHVGNTYVLPDGSGGLLDFQLLVKGHPMIDVTYYLMTALDIENRRQHERALIQEYLDTLKTLGVDAPTIAQAWHDHRVAALWGLVIGWLITPPVNYGETITTANLERLTQAVIDLDAFAALDPAQAAAKPARA